MVYINKGDGIEWGKHDEYSHKFIVYKLISLFTFTLQYGPSHSPSRSPSRISHLLVEQAGGSKAAPLSPDRFPPLLQDSFMVSNYLKTKRCSV